MTLGQQIKEAREKKNMSQEELAESIGVSRQAVSKWENDTALPHGINRDMLIHTLELEIESDIVIQKQVPFIAWIGWILAGVMFLVLAFACIKFLPAMLKPIDEKNIVTSNTNTILAEKSVETEEIDITSIRFFDSAANEIYSDAGWYNVANVNSIIISWSGGSADSIQMFVIPTGTQTLEETKLLSTKIITDGENIALLSADTLHDKKIATSHLYFEICIGESILRSETFNVFYDPNDN